MIGLRKKEAATYSLDGAVAASIKLVQNYILTQFILQTRSLYKNYQCTNELGSFFTFF